MKYITLKFLSVFIILSASSADIDKSSKDISHRILVFGLDDSRIASNIFLKDSIAYICKIPKDSLAASFNDMIIGRLCELNRSYQYIFPENYYDPVDLSGKILFFENDRNQVIADLSRIGRDEFKMLLKKHNASYLLIINRYNLQWKGDPFNSLFYEVDYELISSAKKKILDDKSEFYSSDLLPFHKLQKKYKKQVKKIASRVEKALD